MKCNIYRGRFLPIPFPLPIREPDNKTVEHSGRLTLLKPTASQIFLDSYITRHIHESAMLKRELCSHANGGSGI